MSKKIRIEIDFDISDRVYMVTDENDQVPAIVTQIIFTGTEATYMVARGFDEKICCANELRDTKDVQ